MITGEFTEDNQIIVKLTLFGTSERPAEIAEIEAILDTGLAITSSSHFLSFGSLGLWK